MGKNIPLRPLRSKYTVAPSRQRGGKVQLSIIMPALTGLQRATLDYLKAEIWERYSTGYDVSAPALSASVSLGLWKLRILIRVPATKTRHPRSNSIPRQKDTQRKLTKAAWGSILLKVIIRTNGAKWESRSRPQAISHGICTWCSIRQHVKHKHSREIQLDIWACYQSIPGGAHVFDHLVSKLRPSVSLTPLRFRASGPSVPTRRHCDSLHTALGRTWHIFKGDIRIHSHLKTAYSLCIQLDIGRNVMTNRTPQSAGATLL